MLGWGRVPGQGRGSPGWGAFVWGAAEVEEGQGPKEVWCPGKCPSPARESWGAPAASWSHAHRAGVAAPGMSRDTRGCLGSIVAAAVGLKGSEAAVVRGDPLLLGMECSEQLGQADIANKLSLYLLIFNCVVCDVQSV